MIPESILDIPLKTTALWSESPVDPLSTVQLGHVEIRLANLRLSSPDMSRFSKADGCRTSIGLHS